MKHLCKIFVVFLLSLGFSLTSFAQNIDANLRQKFVSSIGANNDDELGSVSTVATDGVIAVVGAASDDQGGTDRGAIYILGKDVGGLNNWGLIKKVINGTGTNTTHPNFYQYWKCQWRSLWYFGKYLRNMSLQ
ncbi:MAG: hypothetical protein R2822_25440 [Spirosomataceae bacterium]